MAARTTIRTPMPIKLRAKQFMMFDAMKGLTDAITAKEQQVYPKRELTEERINEINQCLSKLQTGDRVTLSYYCQYGKQYCQLTGTVTRIDSFWQEIQIGSMTICFSKIDTIITQTYCSQCQA